MLNRTRKAFTLLELMVAFIIMAILSAVAIPSLIRIVAGDQASANNTSAVAIADAGYYAAESAYPSGFPLTTASFARSGAATAVSYDATTNCLTVSFPQAPLTVPVTVTNADTGSSPVLGC